MQMKLIGLSSVAALLGAGLIVSFPASAQDAGALPQVSQPTGGPVTEVSVAGGNRALFKIAVTPPSGDGATATTISETASRDFTLSSLFQVLDPKSFTADLAKEGLTIDPSSWRNVGAEGVIKGAISQRGASTHLELRLYVVSRGADAVLKKEYDVPQGGVRGAVHQFANEVVKWFTGTAGSFGTRMVFAASTGQGQKGVFTIESDGQGLGRLKTESNVAIAPSIGPGGVYYSGGLSDGSYALFKVGNPAAVLKHAGLVFGAAFSGSKMAVVIAKDGKSEIYTGGADGSGLKAVTNGGLNTHPSWGPGGQLAYVSNQGGSPQIYIDGKRVSFRGTYNMAPVFCNDPEGARLLFMGRDGGTWDIFSVDLGGGNMKRLTQDQGSNMYPACSPDGRTVAFFSTRGGLFTANPQGMNQQKISSVTGESLRWEGN